MGTIDLNIISATGKNDNTTVVLLLPFNYLSCNLWAWAYFYIFMGFFVFISYYLLLLLF